MRNTMLILMLVVATQLNVNSTPAREPKEYDRDVNYKEERLPSYDLPPLLLTAEGKKITTADEWTNIRRPQIISLFSNLVYGRVPAQLRPSKRSTRLART